MHDMVNRLHYDIEVMTRRLELEKRRLHRLENELAAAQKMHRTKRAIGASDGGTVALTSLEADEAPTWDSEALASGRERSEDSTQGGGGSRVHVPMKVLMNRLDFHRKQLNEHKGESADLRNEIDSMRRARLACNDVFEKLRQEIALKAGQLSDFVHETQAREALHGDVKHRMAVMKDQREAERGQFKTEVMRMRDQLKFHALDKKKKEVQIKNAKGVQKKRELIIPEEETTFSEVGMMRRILKTAFLNCIQRRHIKQHQKSIEVFMQAFATIKQSTGIEHIEEIVKIFVSHETRNYSLLTYANHMNCEIEALEGRRRERRRLEIESEQQSEGHLRLRQGALLDIERQLQSTQASLAENRAAHHEHDELFESLLPLLRQIADRIENQAMRLRGNSGGGNGGRGGATLGGSGGGGAAAATAEGPLRRRPEELRKQAVPQWLQWIEQSLGKFRELLPGAGEEAWGDGQGPFPVTAAGQVRQLQPKRLGGQVPPAPLVKAQELPSSITVSSDDPSQAKASKAQKADLLDEENEEEDFADRPLPPVEIRARAKQAAERRFKRIGRGVHVSSPTSPMSPMSPMHGTGDTAELYGDRPLSRGSRLGDSLKNSEIRVGGGAGDVAAGGGAGGASGHRKTSGNDSSAEALESASAADEEVKALALVAASAGEPLRRQASPFSDCRAETPMLPPGTFGASGVASIAGQAVSAQQAQGGGHPPREVSDAELNMNFLMKYKMSKADLQVMADRMGIDLVGLCNLKYEFDRYDEDKSGYVDVRELRSLLQRLGDEVGEEELDEALGELDAGGSGEIEFFDFAEWHCAYKDKR